MKITENAREQLLKQLEEKQAPGVRLYFAGIS
jgi:hypothetical protein